MNTKPKRTRADSAASAVKAMVDAAKDELQPPEPVVLTPAAQLFWGGITRARARDEWCEADLVVAAQLAETQAAMAEEALLLKTEGRVIKNDRGTPIMNARQTVMVQLANLAMALRRSLQMGGRGIGDPRDNQGKRKIEQQSRKLRGELEEEDDGLLAT